MEEFTGTVTRWIDRSGYGFIREDGTGDTVFVHESSIRMEGWRCLQIGGKVTYRKTGAPGRWVAQGVQPDAV